MRRDLAWIDEAPGLALVGPVVWLQAIRCPEVVDGVHSVKQTMEVLAELEMGGRCGLLDGPGRLRAQHLVGESTNRFSVPRVTQSRRAGTYVAASTRSFLTDEMRTTSSGVAPAEISASRKDGRLGQGHDHALLVDPDPTRHVYNAEAFVDEMCLIR